MQQQRLDYERTETNPEEDNIGQVLGRSVRIETRELHVSSLLVIPGATDTNRPMYVFTIERKIQLSKPSREHRGK